ncbi:MAG: 8-oxo-dGDP phosphatase [Nocardioidaceae bacterium]|jgi:ADP-ribose pyrophosphatase|nr:8-oxo-dGDP phosphatase [Nocardioidaceae bacterium]
MPSVADSDMSWPVLASDEVYRGSIVGVRRDVLRAADGSSFERDVVMHHGAVAVVAIDDQERVLVVTQYRHPARQRLVELPAGLLDKPGEDPLAAARREFEEEGQARAERWSKLVDLMPSPGVSDEMISIFLAEEVSDADVPAGFVAEHEESTMTRQWVPLADVVDAVLAGEVKNAMLVAGALAAWVTRHGPPR